MLFDFNIAFDVELIPDIDIEQLLLDIVASRSSIKSPVSVSSYAAEAKVEKQSKQHIIIDNTSFNFSLS